MERYARQIALPEIDLLKQEKLSKTTLVMIGAGGLGSAALPYLAGAGVGNIVIIDHDEIDISNLARQTIYKTKQCNQPKAHALKTYLEELNPDIQVTAIETKLNHENGTALLEKIMPDVILDGSDNFATKALLNDLSIQLQRPLISASVNQFKGQIGLFEGYKKDKACYRCLFPDFSSDTKNCNEAGILGTSAGIIGLLQAHITLGYLTNIEELNNINFIQIDLKTLRIQKIKTTKSADCPSCKESVYNSKTSNTAGETNMVEIITITELNTTDTTIIDVRQPEEISNDPLQSPEIKTAPLNIPLPELVSRLNELPDGTRLAFICAGNIRSRQAAEYLDAKGYKNVCILDKFSF